MINHPYIKYAVAILGKNSYDEVTAKDLIKCLKKLSKRIRMTCPESVDDKHTVYTVTSGLPKDKNDCLAPYICTSEEAKLLDEVDSVIKALSSGKTAKQDVKQCVFPISKDYVRFSDTGGSKTFLKVFPKDYALLMVTTLTEEKPCVAEYVGRGNVSYFLKDYKRGNWSHTCLIPDLSVQELTNFINLFKKIQKQKCPNLKTAEVVQIKKKAVTCLPNIFHGNFPNTSRFKYLKVLAILGCIGEMVKESKYSHLANSVIDSFNAAPILIVSAEKGECESVQISHNIIDIAKNGNLGRLIDQLFYTKLYRYKGVRRNDYSYYKEHGIDQKLVDLEYKKYDLCLSRFLILFNRFTFNEFMTIRAEYPSIIKIVLTKYLQSMEQIGIDIINSAEALGAWLNASAFRVAIKEEAPNEEWETLSMEKRQKVTEKKYKFLVELESSIFSASDSLSLISHTITRAGRLSESDAPDDARLFIKAAMSSKISLEVAKNLLIAFSRIRSTSSGAINLTEREVVESVPDCSNL